MQRGDPEVGEDALLGGRVRLVQPRQGFRVAIDAVLLAAAVDARPGERVLDVGCGVGAAALCLAARLPGVDVVGVDCDQASIALAADNARRNGVADRVTFVEVDVAAPPAALAAGSFDHVMTNPPHLAAGRGRPSPMAGKASSTVEGRADLAAWLRFCAARARRRGSVTAIHRADRLVELLPLLAAAVGAPTILPLWPGGEGAAARRVIVAARLGVGGPARLLPGLVLHGAGGGFTAAAEAILRGGAALPLDLRPA